MPHQRPTPYRRLVPSTRPRCCIRLWRLPNRRPILIRDWFFWLFIWHGLTIFFSYLLDLGSWISTLDFRRRNTSTTPCRYAVASQLSSGRAIMLIRRVCVSWPVYKSDGFIVLDVSVIYLPTFGHIVSVELYSCKQRCKLEIVAPSKDLSKHGWYTITGRVKLMKAQVFRTGATKDEIRVSTPESSDSKAFNNLFKSLSVGFLDFWKFQVRSYSKNVRSSWTTSTGYND